VSIDYPGDYEAAVAFLDRRIGYGVRPGLERIKRLLGLMGDPQEHYPVVHVAGTNGKTTVVRMTADLLGAHGLLTGAFISPHLQRVEERYMIGGAPVAPARLVRAVGDVAPFVVMQEERFDESPTYFELTAAVGFGAFSVDVVDVAVVEVGLGGRWDATNVVNAEVSVISGIALDHTGYLGETQAQIAAEKAAILKDDGVLITGPITAEAEGAVRAQVEATGSTWFRAGTDFDLVDAVRDERGWVATISGIYETYEDIVLPLHGHHQMVHLATAIAAGEAFFGRALDRDAVVAAAGAASAPGRLEVAGLDPLVLIDGAHNAEGFVGLAETMATEFTRHRWTLVIGARGGRDVGELVAPLSGAVERVIATAADDFLAVPAADVAAAVGPALDLTAEVVEPVAAAVEAAIAAADSDVGVVVAGSLYVVGEARHALGLPNSPSPVHQRFTPPGPESEFAE